MALGSDYFRASDWHAPQTFTFGQESPGFSLESGRMLSPVTLAYETYGRLAPDGKNALLLAHALTGSARAAGPPDENGPGWWDALIGSGRLFDTERYFVLCVNVLGSCYGSTGPAALNPPTGRPFGMEFPVITIRDMVRAQKKLLDFLGVKKLVAVAGGSMGGMQALEWAVTYPELVDLAVTIAASERLTPLAIAYNQAARRAIMNDPDWRRGDYYGRTFPADGLALARMVGTITYKSNQAFEERFGRKLSGNQANYYDFFQDFAVESYLSYQGEKLVKRFDANSYLYMTKAMDLHDLACGYSSAAEAFRRIRGRVLLVGISSDLLFPPQEVRGLAVELRRHGVAAEYREIQSPFGHDAFLIEFEQMSGLVKGFLNP